jgi:DNA-directed RNA polymerase subunit H (RpoH/RPB5)
MDSLQPHEIHTIGMMLKSRCYIQTREGVEGVQGMQDVLVFTTTDTSSDNKCIGVYCQIFPKLGVKTIKVIENLVKTFGINYWIVVYQISMSPIARGLCVSGGHVIEPWKRVMIQCDIMSHVLQPEFRLIEDEEWTRIKAFYGPRAALPILSINDPVCRYHQWKIGQGVWIIRRDQTTMRIVGE